MTLARFFRVLRQRLRSLGRPARLDADLDRELAFHFDRLVEEKTSEGATLAEAQQLARREFGNVALIADQTRDQRRVGWLHDLGQDLSYGARMLRRTPGLTTVALASLALGIGANAAVFGAMHAIMFEPLPLVNPDRLVMIRTVPLDNPAQRRNALPADFLAWSDTAGIFEAIGATLAWTSDFGAADAGTPAERITGQAATPGWFATLAVPPLYGRVFNDDDGGIAPRDRVVILSYRLWQRRFGASSAVLNSRIRVDGAFRTIVGVMPQDFEYQDRRVDYWIPLSIAPNSVQDPQRFYSVIARLKSDVTVAHAQSVLEPIASRLARESPERSQGWGVKVVPLQEALFDWAKQPLVTLEAAVACVLLIACANLAGLLLARSASRHREMSVRAALGARRARLVRQLLAESLLLSAMGGLLAVIVATIGLRVLAVTLSPPLGAPRMLSLGMHIQTLGLTAVLALATGLGFGLAPALAGSRMNVVRALNESSPGSVMGRRPFHRSMLVSAQIALALILLIGSGLLLNSFIRLAGRDLGFDPAGLISFEFHIPSLQYARPLGIERGVPLFELSPPPSLKIQEVYERLRNLPGVESAAGSSFAHVDSLVLPAPSLTIEGRPLPETDAERRARAPTLFLVTPDFFATLRAPLIRGRDFNDRDTAAAPWVAVVNDTAARRLWPGEDAIGKRLTVDSGPDERPRTVIGVVRDIAIRSRQTTPEPVIYASYLQQPSRYQGRSGGMFGQMTFILRHRGEDEAVVAAARRAVAEVDPNRPLTSVNTAGQHLGQLMREFRDYVLVLAAFALAATLLAAIGIYGVVAYSVTQRTREIGIRRALGAGTSEIVALVGKQAVVVAAAGVAAGLAGAVALTPLIASQLWGVAPVDPLTFACVSAVIAAAALLACLVPTRRALAVDPTVALRSE